MLKFNPLSGKFDEVVDDHIKLKNIGTNTHAEIDTHIADSSIHQTKYTDAEAVAAVLADDAYVKNTGDTMTGELEVEDHIWIGLYDGSATKYLNIYQGVYGTAGQYAYIYADWDSLYLGNEYGGIYLEGAESELRALKIQEYNSPWEVLSWWFDGSSVGGTGMWIKMPASAGGINLKLGTSNGSYNFTVWNSDGYERFLVEDDGNVGINTGSPTAKLDINSDILRLRTAKTPATSGAAGNAGDICWDASYIYICTATNNWERAPISTW